MEQTFVMVKNDGVMRRLVGEVIKRFESKGLYLVQSKVVVPTMSILEQHYAEHVTKSFFGPMAQSMCQSQVVPMVWAGENAVAVARKLIGATRPSEAVNGSIRGDFAISMGKNIIHGADSVDAAKREISIWFGEDLPEIVYFDKNALYE